ncbi:MAG: eL32 family ribosomal protein [archaeon]
MKRFLRRDSNRYVKLGKRNKSKQRWRSPKGRHNKMRNKMKGYPAVVSIGYKKQKTEGKKQKDVRIRNTDDLMKIKSKTATIGKVGRRKKIEIAKKARELKINIQNLNMKKILKEKKNESVK